MSTFQIFSASQINDLRIGGGILRECLQHVARTVQPGVTTAFLDKEAEAFILERGGIPAFKGYQGFPATLCISVNDEVVHGIPGPRVLHPGDIVSLDGGVLYGGLYTDACITVPVADIPPATQAFLECVAHALELVTSRVVSSGVHVGTISSTIQKHIKTAGYSVVRELTGHGLGTELHQYPSVPNIGKKFTGPILPVGTMIAVEPIATMGAAGIMTDEDKWTIRTRDGSLACHFEHSLLITEEGCEVIA